MKYDSISKHDIIDGSGRGFDTNTTQISGHGQDMTKWTKTLVKRNRLLDHNTICMLSGLQGYNCQIFLAFTILVVTVIKYYLRINSVSEKWKLSDKNLIGFLVFVLLQHL